MDENKATSDLNGFTPVQVKPRTRTKWTSVMITDLKRYVDEGLTDIQIAERMGLDAKVVTSKRVLMGFSKRKTVSAPAAPKPANPNPDYRPPLRKEHDPPKATIIPERPAKDYTNPMTAALVNILAGAPVGVRVLIDGKPIEKIVARVEYDLEGKEDQRDIVLMSKDFGKEISDAEV